MGAAVADLFYAIERILGESAPATPEQQAETQRLLEQLCGEYLAADADGRAAIRAFAASQSLYNRWLFIECARRLVERVTGPDAVPALRLALAAVSVENCSFDYRDTCLVVSELYARAEREGIDPKPVFEAAATISTDSPTIGGCTSLAAILRQAGP